MEIEEPLQNELISFMFLRDTAGRLDVMSCLKLWFGKSNDTDIEIQERFGIYVASALRGELDHWRATPRGCLALMILVDQFPRNIYRHTVRSFSGDRMSRDMVYSAGHDWLKVLQPEECIFVPCLIMTHQENITDQEYGMKFYERLEPLLPPSLHIFRMIFEEHLRIISLCGGFPHRDHYYNRTTTAIGKSLMDNPTVRFDLPLCAGADGRVFFGHDPQKLLQATQRTFDVVDRIDALINHSARRRSSMAPSYMTPKRSAEFAEIFRTFDKDGSGFLEVEELNAVLSSTGHRYSDVELQEAVDHVTGRKGSGGLTFLQFANLLRINLSSTLEVRMKEHFDIFDADGSGEVTIEEFTACVQGLDALVTTAEAAAMFQKCDSDESGSISFQEFLVAMESKLTTTGPLAGLGQEVPPASAGPAELAPTLNTSIWAEKRGDIGVLVSELGVDPRAN